MYTEQQYPGAGVHPPPLPLGATAPPTCGKRESDPGLRVTIRMLDAAAGDGGASEILGPAFTKMG